MLPSSKDFDPCNISPQPQLMTHSQDPQRLTSQSQLKELYLSDLGKDCEQHGFSLCLVELQLVDLCFSFTMFS
ncbi:hypothetical protein SCA6_018650 [Theobroma cacao]